MTKLPTRSPTHADVEPSRLASMGVELEELAEDTTVQLSALIELAEDRGRPPSHYLAALPLADLQLASSGAVVVKVCAGNCQRWGALDLIDHLVERWSKSPTFSLAPRRLVLDRCDQAPACRSSTARTAGSWSPRHDARDGRRSARRAPGSRCSHAVARWSHVGNPGGTRFSLRFALCCSLEKVNKFYQVGAHSLHVLRDVDFEVGDGEFVLDHGAHRAPGKSTLLNILGILDDYDSGEYWLGDTLIQCRLSERKAADYRNRFIGFVFQSFNLLPVQDRARERCAAAVLPGQFSRRKRNQIAMQYLERVRAPRLGRPCPRRGGGRPEAARRDRPLAHRASRG